MEPQAAAHAGCTTCHDAGEVDGQVCPSLAALFSAPLLVPYARYVAELATLSQGEYREWMAAH